jgi:hypothetical protein
MSPLPYGLTEPLHIEEPFPWLLVFNTLLAIFLLIRRWLKKRRQRVEKRPERKTPVRAKGLAHDIALLRERYRGHKANFRAACHELSALLRDHLEVTRRKPYGSLTAREMAKSLGDDKISRFFALLSELQFSRRRPTRSDFEGACSLALEASGEKGKRT